MARSRTVREKGELAHKSMDPESRKRVGESSSTQRSVPKSRNRRSLAASSSPAPRRGAPKKKPRRRKEAESEKQFSLQDPGILDQKEENGKVYYLLNWADDPDTGEHFEPSWEPYDNVALDVVADWQSRKPPVGGARAEGATNSHRRGIIDLTGEDEDSIQDSQSPRPAKRRRITHGPNPTSEEQTPEKKPRKVGTVESARFQSVSQDSVSQEEKPNEIKDSYEEDQQLTAAGVGKARVEIPGPQEGFDRDAYSRVVTSSQPSQPFNTPKTPQSSQSQDFSSSQIQTPAPRHKYSSLIWDEDIEGIIPDSQELGSSSYIPSTTQVSQTVSTSLENSEVQTETDTEAAGYTQVISGGEYGASGTVDSQSAEPIDALTQASYFDNDVQSSSVPTESSEVPSLDRHQTRTQQSVENQARGSEPLAAAAASSNTTQPEAEHNLSLELRTLPDSSLHEGLTQAFPTPQQSSAALEEAGSSHNSVAQVVVEQSSPPISSDSSPQSRETKPEVRSQNKSPTPLDEVPSSPPNLLTSHDSGPLHDDSIERYNAPDLSPQFSQALISDFQDSSSIAFGTQVPFQRFEDKENHFVSSSPSIRSTSVRSSSAPSPSVPTAFASLAESQSARRRDQPNLSIEQDIEQSQTLPLEPYQPQVPIESSSSHTAAATQTFFTAPATPVQTPREDLDDSSVERTSSDISGSSFQSPEINTEQSPSNSHIHRSQSASTEPRSQHSSNSLPSPPSEKTDSSGEQFAQLTSQNRPSTPSQHTNRPGSTVEQSSPSPSRRSTENLETMTFQQSQSSQPVLSNSTMDDSPASTSAPTKADNPLLAKLKLRKAEAIARKAAERERAASASRSLPHSPAPLSPALQSPAPQSIAFQTQIIQPPASSTDFQSPVLRSPVPLSPEPQLVPAHEAIAAVNHAAVLANQALPVQAIIEEIASTLEPIISPTISPEVEAEPELELPPTTLRVLPQDREQYAVPLPMVSFARDVYVNAIRSRKNQRYEFLTDEVFDASLVGEIDAMMSELDLLCSHQDLIQDDFATQRMDKDDVQSKWAENVSTKCIFLVEFLSLMQTEAKQIAILIRPGRMLEIIEAVFNWHGFVYSRADRPGYTGNTSGGPMKISLIPTRGEILEFEPPSIVIAFDSTYNSVPFMKDLQVIATSPTKLVPLLSLVVINSIEHLEKCFHGNLEPVERKIKLVSCLTQIKDNVGKLGIGYHDPPAAAKAVADYVMNGAVEGTWPLQSLPDIEDLKLDVDSSQSQQSQEGPSEIPSSSISLAQVSQFGMKRQLAVGDHEGRESPKRQRLTPTSGESDPSHIGDTVLHPSSHKHPSASSVEASKIIAKTNALDDEQSMQISALLKKVTDLEIQLRSKEATESELRQMNQDLETRCQDYESSIASIQPKYQEALNDRGEFEHENNLAKIRQTHLLKELETKDAEVTKLRDLKATVEKELAEARTALSSSSIPEIAEMGKLKEELLQEKSEKERLQKRLTNMQGDLEYMRNNYQNSSTLAAEHASENQALQTELAKLKEKDKRDMVRIHEIQKNNELKEYSRRIKELKEENSGLERELEKKQDELKALMNGRRATRGTSVPRSPRMGTGGTMSPGPRPMARAMQMGNIGMAMSGANSGSRGNSPAPGDLGGFRGTGTFVGEALFQDNRPPGGVRWGNHLQQ
ncbi:hypothetical protein N431DRAFT_388862 [Stipitochalara longipes BDJ]|nr:hypothetical protein N431DRAFT_388862 [Stipitochalara longipes BDJ]